LNRLTKVLLAKNKNFLRYRLYTSTHTPERGSI
jgi:hypothetical protein